jgi:hypothetical protein
MNVTHALHESTARDIFYLFYSCVSNILKLIMEINGVVVSSLARHITWSKGRA